MKAKTFADFFGQSDFAKRDCPGAGIGLSGDDPAGVPAERVIFCGNVMIDSLLSNRSANPADKE